MSACAQLAAGASLGAGPALRAVDCMAGEMAAAAFGRLFGAEGALAPALTVLLTLYIAFFALSLMLEAWSIGRARRAIARLLDLVPPMARLVTAQGEREVPPSEVPEAEAMPSKTSAVQT